MCTLNGAIVLGHKRKKEKHLRLHQDVGLGVHVVGVGGGVVTTGDGHRYAFHLFSNGRRFPFELGQTSSNTATG